MSMESDSSAMHGAFGIGLGATAKGYGLSLAPTQEPKFTEDTVRAVGID